MSTWRETSDKYQCLVNGLDYMEGLMAVVFYENENSVAQERWREFQSFNEDMRAETVALWRQAWADAGQPDPMPSFTHSGSPWTDGLWMSTSFKEEVPA